MTSISKLDYVMKTLDILGVEVASYLGTDATTVSKWRNNQRKIPYKNGTARKLSEFILRKEKEQNTQAIFNILKTIKEDINPESMGQKIETLSQWLTEKNLDYQDKRKVQYPVFTPQNGYNTNISILLGENGIDEAIALFFEYVLQLPPGKTIYLVDHSGINWIRGDETTEKQVRINNCMQYFRTAVEYGHKIVIIECNLDLYRPYRVIFRWMQLYLLDGVEMRTYPILNDEETCNSTTFLVENEIILQCISQPDFGSRPHGMLYTNRETVNFYASTVHSIWKKSKRLLETIPSKDIGEIANIMSKNVKPGRHIYMLNPSIILQVIERGLLQEILEENKVSESKIEEILTAAKKIRRIQAINRCSSIYDLDMLGNFTATISVVDRNLSEICERKIYLSKNYQRKIMDSIINSDAYQSDSFALISFSYLNSLPIDLSILVQEDSFVSVWNAQKYQKRLYCFDLDVIAGFYRYVDDLKTAIPKICWNREWKEKQLIRIRETI